MKKNWSVKTREKFFCLEVFRSTTRLNGGENYISVQTDPSFLFPETERERESYLYVRKKNGRREREREGSRPCQSKQGLEADFLFCFPSSFLIFRLRVAAMLAWQNRRRTDQEKPLWIQDPSLVPLSLDTTSSQGRQLFLFRPVPRIAELIIVIDLKKKVFFLVFDCQLLVHPSWTACHHVEAGRSKQCSTNVQNRCRGRRRCWKICHHHSVYSGEIPTFWLPFDVNEKGVCCGQSDVDASVSHPPLTFSSPFFSHTASYQQLPSFMFT